MNTAKETTDILRSDSTTETANLGSTLLRVAWLAIVLGLLMEVILLALAASAGKVASVKPFVADLVQKLSWSFIVCTGLALGTAASHLRVPLMGIAGLIAAPLAFNIARSLHKAAAQVLTITISAPTSPSPLLLASIKAVEYGCLGIAIAWIANRAWGGIMAHIGAGLAAGILFGGIVIALMYTSSPTPMPTPILISRSVNEIVFPVGCSLVLFTAVTLGKRLRG